MTTDYEKRYNEALERARKALSEIPLESYGARKIIIDAFPELAESEDERIRQSLLAYIKGESKRLDTKKWIAYLEKQKEQKPWRVGANAYFTPEQKPVEKAAFTPVDTELTEFEKAVVKLCQIGKDEYPCYEFAKKYAPSLLDLAKKEVNKPAEWSEEDEHRIKLIRQCIVSCPSISGVDGNEVELLEFLDSLRPSWKPSEEQMEAFRSYIKDFQEKAEAAVGGWNNFDVMIRLYEHLKKLM